MKPKKLIQQLLFMACMLYLTQNIEAQSLKSLTDAKGKYIGNLMSDGFFTDHQINNGATDLIAKTEYNTLVAGNKMKMSNLLKKRPVDPFNIQISDINTADIDRFVAYANANGMRKRGHVMIWYKQIPTWLTSEAPTWTAQQIYDFSRSYIFALSTYTAGKIDEWDVLNEAVLDGNSGYRTGTWYDIVNTQANSAGNIGYMEYFSSLFKWARQGNPNVPLFYNDYNIEPFGTNKNNFMRTMVKALKNTYNTPITGVGLQSHFSLSAINSTFINNLGQTIDDLGASGFTVNLTELDIKICDGDVVTLEDQRIAYRDVVSTALSRSNCNTVLMWGMSDNDSWIPLQAPGCGQATPHNDLLQKKPAYYGIQEALASLTGSVTTSICAGGSYTWPANGVTYTTAQTGLSYTVGSNTSILNLTIATTVGTPTPITISSGSEPSCKLINGTTTTTYTTTATNNSSFNWSLSNPSAGSINATTGVMTWANGFSGSVNIQVTANGCNATSSQVTRTVTITTAVCDQIWDFNNTLHSFTADNNSSIALGATYATYSLNTGVSNPNLDNLSAGIDPAKKYIAITLKNNTANKRLQVITNRVATPAVFTNFDGIIANDPGFTTYYIDMTANAGWTGIVNQITFRFKLNSASASPETGTILIDKIEILSAIPTTPVGLINFTAKSQNNSALLNWSTSSEQNNSHFKLSHATDGVNFSLLSNVQASANGYITNNYSYVHLNPVNGANYYHLEQVDLDGTSRDLGIKAINFSLVHTQKVLIYPNPTQNEVKVSFAKDFYTTAKLMDLQGKTLQKKSILLNDTELTFDFKALDAGNYLIQLEGKGMNVQKVVKE